MKLKTIIKVFAPIVMVAISSNAHAVKWVGEMGLHGGGDKLASATYTNGDTATITAGALFSFSIGPQIEITNNTHIRALFNYKSDKVSASNGNISFTRYPIDVMYFYQTEQWNFGGGVTYHLSPELTGSGVANGINGKFDSAFGFIAEIDFRLGDFYYVGGKFTSIDYKPQLSGASTVDGNSIGVVMGFIFGD